jgi:hypothetical protein
MLSNYEREVMQVILRDGDRIVWTEIAGFTSARISLKMFACFKLFL